MVVRYVVGEPETVDASTLRRFLGHLPLMYALASRAEGRSTCLLWIPNAVPESSCRLRPIPSRNGVRME
jgi:hypothetical protein